MQSAIARPPRTSRLETVAAPEPAVREEGRRIDVFRLFVSLFGVGLYLGVPAAGVTYLVVAFAQRLLTAQG